MRAEHPHTGKRAAAADQENGSVVLRPSGGIDRPHARSFLAQANLVLKEGTKPSRVVLDLRDAKRIDGVGVALVRELEDRCRREGIAFSIEGAAPGVSEFLDFVRGRSREGQPQTVPETPPLAALSREASRWARSFKEFTAFVGRFAARAAFLVTRPRRIRLGEMVYQLQKAGAEGTWLLVGLSLLLGVIMAFQGLTGARGFGSPLIVADVVTLSTTREMAPLLTGVIVTGRSGAAIAAEIGSMKIHEELDALSVMGFDLMHFLFIPRTLALAIATPLLTLLSIGAGILGGAAVAVFYLHLSAAAYFTEVQNAISATQIASALVKGITFGLVIALISCFEGLQAGKAAEDVGKQTTAAVVRGILAIIFADAFFSIISEVYKW